MTHHAFLPPDDLWYLHHMFQTTTGAEREAAQQALRKRMAVVAAWRQRWQAALDAAPGQRVREGRDDR